MNDHADGKEGECTKKNLEKSGVNAGEAAVSRLGRRTKNNWTAKNTVTAVDKPCNWRQRQLLTEKVVELRLPLRENSVRLLA